MSAVSAYGIYVTADNVTIEDLNVDAANTTHFGIKVNPDTGVSTDALTGFSLKDVTVTGAGRSEIDLNGVDNSSLTNVTADGAGTPGVGIALSDSTGITLTDITTMDNAWGSVGLYSAGRSYEAGTSDITFAGTYASNESFGIYADEESGTAVADIDFGAIHGSGTTYIVQNSTFRDASDGRSDDFSMFFGDETSAVGLAASFLVGPVDHSSSSVITIDESNDSVDAATGTTFIVADGMSIQAAIDAASDGDTIYVRAGTYAETLTIDVDVTIIGPNEGIAGDGTRGAEAVIDGTVNITADGVTLDGLSVAPSTAPAGPGDNLIAVSGSGVALDNMLIDSGRNTAGEYMFAVFGTADGLSVNDSQITRVVDMGDTTGLSRGLIRSSNADNVDFSGNTLVNGNILVTTGDGTGFVTGVVIENNTITASTTNGESILVAGAGYGPLPDALMGLQLDGNTFTTDLGLTIRDADSSDDLSGFATAQNDNFLGNGGDDTIAGGEGEDTLDGGSGADQLGGGAGADTLSGGDDGDVLDGGAGADMMAGGLGSDTIYSTDGDDVVFGGSAIAILPPPSPVPMGIVAPEVDTLVLGDNGGVALDIGTIDFSGFDASDGVSYDTIVIGGRTITVTDIEVLRVDNTEGGSATYIVREGMSLRLALDAAQDGDTILVGPGTFGGDFEITSAVTIIGAGDDQTTLLAMGSALTIDSDLGTDAEVTVSGINFAGSGIAGIDFTNTAVLGTLTVTDSEFSANGYNGIRIGGGVGPVDLDNVVITGTDFIENGQPQSSSGDGDLLFYQYYGDVTMTDVNITGGDRGTGPGENAIQFRGDAGSLGTVSLTNVTVDGTYEKVGVAFYNYDDITGLSADNVVVSANSGWGLAVNIDGVGGNIDYASLDIDTSGSMSGVALQGDGDDQTITSGAEDAFLRGGEGNDTLDGGDGDDTAVYATAASNYTVAVTTDASGRATSFDSVTDNNVSVGGNEGTDTLTGIETITFAGSAMSLDAPVQLFDASGNLSGTFTTIQAAIDAASSGYEISVAAGTYDEDLEINTIGLTINGANVGVDANTGTRGAETVINGTITINGSYVTLDGMSVDYDGAVPGAGDNLITVHGNFNLLSNMDISAGRNAAGEYMVAVFNDGQVFGVEYSALTREVDAGDTTGLSRALIRSSGSDSVALRDNVLTDGNIGITTGDGTNAPALGIGVVRNTVTASETNADSVFITGPGYGPLPDGLTIDFRDNVYTTDAGTQIRASNLGDDLTSFGSDGNDLIMANDGSDLIVSGDGDDTVTGGDGDDVVVDTGGNDSLDGNAGQDLIDYSSVTSSIFLDLASGLAIGLPGGVGTDTVLNFEDATTGDGNDLILGTSVDNSLTGNGGNDTLFGYGGDDIVDGGAGADVMDGGDGDGDTVVYDDSTAGVILRLDSGTGVGGYAAGDTVLNFENATGSGFDDLLRGTDGANDLTGNDGADTLIGLDGDDTLDGGDGDNFINGGDGNDRMYAGKGGTGNNTMIGGTGDDTAYGGNGDDSITGNNGNDVLNAGGGNDTVIGGFDDDEVYGDDGNDLLDGQAGFDTIEGGDGDDAIFGGTDNDVLIGGGGADSIDAGAHDDYVYGGTGNDTANGVGGDDALYGAEGEDFLRGGSGNDTLEGGDGADTLAGGNDADTLIGGDGDDNLQGQNGDDFLSGGAGDDFLIGATGADTFEFAAGFGNDTLREFEDDLDVLLLHEDLWDGGLTVQQIVDNHATVIGTDTVFDFGMGTTLTVRGVTDAQTLVDDISIFYDL